MTEPVPRRAASARVDHDPRAPNLSVVICVLDEAEAIGGVLDELTAELAGLSFEVLVVDDSVDEETSWVVRGRGLRDPRIRLIRRAGARGLASAAIAGWDAARGEVLALMDGDGQHDPRLIRQLLASLEATGAEVATASRYMTPAGSGLSGFRDAISRIGTRAAQALIGARVTDPLSGLFLMRRAWFEAVRGSLTGVGFKILVDVLTSGARTPQVVEAPTALRTRLGGASKLDLRVMADLAGLLVEKRTRGLIPARLAMFLGVGVSGLMAHLAVLLSGQAAGLSLWAAQALAIFTAMSWNFWANNLLTFRDQRLRGRAALAGLGRFYAGCLVGAVVSEAMAMGLNVLGVPGVAAGLMGAAGGGLFNFAAARVGVWRRASTGPAPNPETPVWREAEA
ncbi:glycosyltransferase [Phenylobacterium aquaticum]|uniref:glycosyltransferase n=1 Tax=Phenylobacterium aquaticum TaxID=1763816 RepID=UPI0026E9E42C|nr:glycosyltransferase [Phenylobacterium aquaticum]